MLLWVSDAQYSTSVEELSAVMTPSKKNSRQFLFVHICTPFIRESSSLLKIFRASFRMAQWIRRPPTERKIPGSIPGVEVLFCS